MEIIEKQVGKAEKLILEDNDFLSEIIFTYEWIFKNNIEENLNKSTAEWRYSREHFANARRNVSPANIPVNKIWWNIARFYIPDHVFFTKIFKQHLEKIGEKMLVEENVFDGKMYQFHTGFIREIDAIAKLLKLKPYYKIIKNLNDDLEKDIDFSIESNNCCINTQVTHEGKTSDEYRNYRKENKSNCDLILIVPRREKYLIDLANINEELGEQINEIVNYKKGNGNRRTIKFRV